MKLNIIGFMNDELELRLDVSNFQDAVKLIMMISHPGVKYRYTIVEDGVEYEAFGCEPYGPDNIDVCFEALTE